jgi:hypothetical protein
MKITAEWLGKKQACQGGYDWFTQQNESDPVRVLNALIAEEYLDWADWLIVRVMRREQYISYAIFAAEQVIDLYEQKYPEDDRPRKAIGMAKVYLENPSKENISAAYVAANTAYVAADAVYAADAAQKEIKIKILNYGLSFLA